MGRLGDFLRLHSLLQGWGKRKVKVAFLWVLFLLCQGAMFWGSVLQTLSKVILHQLYVMLYCWGVDYLQRYLELYIVYFIHIKTRWEQSIRIQHFIRKVPGTWNTEFLWWEVSVLGTALLSFSAGWKQIFQLGLVCYHIPLSCALTLGSFLWPCGQVTVLF